MFNVQVSVDQPSLIEFWQTIREIGTIKKRSYKHDDSVGWPSLKTLIDNDTRLLLFHHNGPNCSVPNTQGCPARILYWFQYVYETDYDFDGVEAIENYENSCPGTRGVGGNDPPLDFFYVFS